MQGFSFGELSAIIGGACALVTILSAVGSALGSRVVVKYQLAELRRDQDGIRADFKDLIRRIFNGHGVEPRVEQLESRVAAQEGFCRATHGVKNRDELDHKEVYHG